MLEEPVASHLPAMVGSSMRLDHLWCTCTRCKTRLDDEHFRGLVDVSTPHVLILTAAGYCEPCNAFTVHRDRYYDDGRVLSFHDGHWVESRLKPKKPSLVSRLRRALVGA